MDWIRRTSKMLERGETPETSEILEEEDMSVSLYGKLLVRYHWIFFVVFLLIHLSFLGVSIALFFQGYDVLPLVFDDIPLQLHNDEMFLRYQAWEYKDGDRQKAYSRRKRSAPEYMSERFQKNFGLDLKMRNEDEKYDFSFSGNSPFGDFNSGKHQYYHNHHNYPAAISLNDISKQDSFRHKRMKRQANVVISSDNVNERRQVLSSMLLIYETTDGSNLLTKERLLAIRKFEEQLEQSPGYSDYCRTEIYNRTHLQCLGLPSLLRFFDPLFVVDHNGTKASDALMQRIPWFMTVLYNSTNFRDEVQYFLGRQSKLDLANDNIETNRIRSQVAFGYPLKEYAAGISNGDPDAQKKLWIKQYGKPYLLKYLNKVIKDPLPGHPIKVLYFVDDLYWSAVQDQVYKDWGFIIGGILLIIFSCWFYFNSLFITLMGMLSIVTSFAGANLMYRYMFEYRYFGIFNILAVFIVIGIGVDDILIYVGTWRHYVNKDVKDLDTLTSVVFKKAAVTMFFTSLSTMVAFFVNTPSILLAISAFGTFAGLCILVNYLTVVTFIPTVVLIHHLYFDKFTFLCCCNRYKRIKKVVQAPPKAVAWHSRPMHGSPWSSSNAQPWGPSGIHQWTAADNRPIGSNNIRPWGLTSDPLFSPFHSSSNPLNVGNLSANGNSPDYHQHFSGQGSMSAIRRVPFYDHIGNQAWSHGNQFGGQDHLDNNIFNRPATNDPLYVVGGNGNNSRTNSSASIIQDTSEPDNVRLITLPERFNNACVSFLSGPFFRFISNELVNVIIFVIFFAITFGNCEAITRLKLGDADIPVFHPNHPFEKSRIAVRDGFLLNPYDVTVKIALLWGLKLQDLSECNRLYYQKEKDRCKGKTVWDNDFDLNDPDSQMGLLNLCKDLIDPDEDLKKKLRLYIDFTTGKTDMICFIYYFDQWLNAVYATTNISSVVDVRMPITKQKMQLFMATQPGIFNPKYITKITRPFELAFEFFLNNGYSGEPVTDERYKLQEAMSFEPINNINIAANNQKGFIIYEKRLKYAAMQIKTTVPSISVDIDTGTKVMNAWEDFINTRLKALPPGVQNGYQVAFTWMWLRTLSNIVIQSGYGLGISLFLAFFVILLGTGNIISSIAILILLAGVTICCVALITLASWKFSLLEAINMCIVVGLAVDYVVHLAESYHLSIYTSRKDRLKDALERVGMPIIAGAATTLMSAVFMLFGKIVFFIQFGSFLFCTLGFSILFTLFVMTSFYSLLGPQGDFGSISGILRVCFGKKRPTGVS